MSLSIFFNVGSIGLGLLAWALPVAVMRRRGGIGLIAASFSACLLSLTLQIFEIKYRVNIGDLSAIMDTIDVLAWVVVVLVAATVLLNGAALTALKKK